MSDRIESGLILVIEDDRGLAETMADCLEMAGHSVDFANDGVSGAALVQRNAYDLVAVDRGLPGMDGLRVTEQLRQQGYRMPILVVSGHAAEDAMERVRQAGADDYLLKPFANAELVARVQRLLQATHRDS